MLVLNTLHKNWLLSLIFSPFGRDLEFLDFALIFSPRTGGEGRRGGAPERVLCQRACCRRAIMSSDDQPLRDQGRRFGLSCADKERKLWAHLRARRFCGIQIQPAAPPWSILRRFLLRHAPPDYRTRWQSTCRAGAGAHGSLENGSSHRAGLSSDAILECRSEHRDRRCARSDLCGAAGFLNRAPWRLR